MSENTFSITEKEVSFLAHELRNPLAAIQLYAELLETGNNIPEDKLHDMAREILTSTKRALDLIEEFRNNYKS